MSKAIYIASSEPYSGKTLIALGLMHMLAGKTKKIAYFKPVINEAPENSKDIHIETIVAQFGLTLDYNDMYACASKLEIYNMKSSRSLES